jgi:hypothetical protein
MTAGAFAGADDIYGGTLAGEDPQPRVVPADAPGKISPALRITIVKALVLHAATGTPQGAIKMAEIYVSTDIEADGPIPGPHSMLSFASAAFTADKALVRTFQANLTTLPGAQGDPQTMAWWRSQPEAWAACRVNPREPAEVMPEYVAWLKALPGKPVFVGYPAAYDFLFVYWYLIRFAGASPFSHSALDIKSYAMALLGTDYRESVKRNMPREWFDALPHTHVALDDAIGQGALFCNMLAARRQLLGRNTSIKAANDP